MKYFINNILFVNDFLSLNLIMTRWAAIRHLILLIRVRQWTVGGLLIIILMGFHIPHCCCCGHSPLSSWGGVWRGVTGASCVTLWPGTIVVISCSNSQLSWHQKPIVKCWLCSDHSDRTKVRCWTLTRFDCWLWLALTWFCYKCWPLTVTLHR